MIMNERRNQWEDGKLPLGKPFVLGGDPSDGNYTLDSLMAGKPLRQGENNVCKTETKIT